MPTSLDFLFLLFMASFAPMISLRFSSWVALLNMSSYFGFYFCAQNVLGSIIGLSFLLRLYDFTMGVWFEIISTVKGWTVLIKRLETQAIS